MGVVLAQDYLQTPEKYAIPPFCVVSGEDAFLRFETIKSLRRQILGDGDADFSFTRLDGSVVSFADVVRETSMIGLFGAGKRLVLVEQADAFLSQNRDALEKYLDEPSSVGILILQLNTFPSNLRLYKKTDAKGLIINCKTLQRKMLAPWLLEWASKRLHATLTRESADVLVELIGDDLGVLEQEIRRLALLAPDGKIGTQLVKENVGSQRLRKVWDLIDVALGGNTAEALRQLDKLLSSGEAPIAILAQMAATLRKIAAVAEIFAEAAPQKSPMSIESALDRVGVQPFVKAKTSEQIKKLGSQRARALVRNLLQADLDMKGASRSDPRVILERFIVQISHPQMKPFELLR